MRHPPEPERNVHGFWRQDELDLPEWTWRHVTSAQGEKLKPMTMYRLLLGYSGLPGPTRAVLRYLADRSDHRGHSYPPIATIARRIGYGQKAVSRAIAKAECEGWVVVDRHPCGQGWPADYWLDVPNLPESPCADEPAVNDWVDDATDLKSEGHDPQVGGTRGSSTSDVSLGSEGHDTSGFSHLGSSHLGSEHRRPASRNGQHPASQLERREEFEARLQRGIDRLREEGVEEEKIRLIAEHSVKAWASRGGGAS